jgi:hypothetical protein
MAYNLSRHQRAVREAQSLRVCSGFLVENSLRLVATISIARAQRMARRSSRTPPWRAATALPKPRRFAMAGIVTAWDPVLRELRIGDRTFSVAAEVSGVGLTQDRHVLLSGEQANRRSPHIVTRLVLRRLAG